MGCFEKECALLLKLREALRDMDTYLYPHPHWGGFNQRMIVWGNDGVRRWRAEYGKSTVELGAML